MTGRKTLAEIRAMTGALGVGLAQAALDASLAYAQQRTQFGKPIAQFQSIAHKLAHMGTQIEAARALVYRAAWLVSAGNKRVRASGPPVDEPITTAWKRPVGRTIWGR